MCSQIKCDYGHQCQDCAHYIKSKRPQNSKTGLDTSDMRAYKREWMRRKRAAQRQLEMEAAGVA